MKGEKLRESTIYKTFYHEKDDCLDTYWLLCRLEKLKDAKYWKILKRFTSSNALFA